MRGVLARSKIGRPAIQGGVMTTLTRWMPLTELPIERRMRRMLDDIGFGPFMVPAADFFETDADFVIELEAPGFDEKELGIEVSDHTLTIEGARKTEVTEEPEKTFRFHERLEKTFERRFYLPPEADTKHVTAKFAKGVLEVHIPRAPEAKPMKVPIDT
jgi:HSP20 family molecular chaperone IbpA